MTEPYTLTVTGVTGFSPFVLRSGGKPTAVALRGLRALPGFAGFLGLAGMGLGVVVRLRRRARYDACVCQMDDIRL